MRNVELEVKGDKLIITVDLQAQGRPSASGKTLVIASTEGNIGVSNGEFKVGLNVYKARG